MRKKAGMCPYMQVCVCEFVCVRESVNVDIGMCVNVGGREFE